MAARNVMEPFDKSRFARFQGNLSTTKGILSIVGFSRSRDADFNKQTCAMAMNPNLFRLPHQGRLVSPA
jgi:hypothetical protein